MAFEDINIKKLRVNPENDRHQPFTSEKEAIEWLLKYKFNDMRNLLRDIIKENALLEPPLVKKDGKGYLVYDGNRRVTCIKIISGEVPSDLDQDLYDKIRSEIPGGYVFKNLDITCRTENDLKLINRLLETRHIPGQSGAGQVNWNNHQKESFYVRTKQYEKISFPRKINDILIAGKYLSDDEEIKLSTFGRLLSSTENKERVGFQVNESNDIIIIKNKDKVLKALARIARDNLTLEETWTAEKVEKYLDGLESENILPTDKDALSQPILLDYPVVQEVPLPSATGGLKRGRPRKVPFFPKDLPQPEASKFLPEENCSLFRELNNRLSLNSHKISMSIVFRSVLESLTNAYIRKYDLEVAGANGKKKLASKIKAVLEHFEKIGADLDKKDKNKIVKMLQSKSIESLSVLNETVHGSFDVPVDDLLAIRNNLVPYFRKIIEDLNKSATP